MCSIVVEGLLLVRTPMLPLEDPLAVGRATIPVYRDDALTLRRRKPYDMLHARVRAVRNSATTTHRDVCGTHGIETDPSTTKRTRVIPSIGITSRSGLPLFDMLARLT